VGWKTVAMQDIRALGQATLDRIRYVLTDIDDTVTTDGRLPAVSYDALERLQSAGLVVIPITGRPAGWCDMIARFWPVDAVVGENGAFYFSYDRKALAMRRTYFASALERDENRRRLEEVRARVLNEVPGAAVASDQAYREADLAIDFCEDVPVLPQSAVDRIVEIFQSVGAQAKVSSIHVNGWFGQYDKLSMTRVMMKEKFGADLDASRDSVAFIGDSPNDEPMFAHFPVSIGVANVRDTLHRFKSLPAYVTKGRGGEGFVEFSDHLIASRAARSASGAKAAAR
jgi:HAD superfamily hydrolase (TIGR01484 family)